MAPACTQLASKANKRVPFGYGLNYLIDIENAVIVDVEATPRAPTNGCRPQHHYRSSLTRKEGPSPNAFRSQAEGKQLTQVTRYVSVAQQHQGEQHVGASRSSNLLFLILIMKRLWPFDRYAVGPDRCFRERREARSVGKRSTGGVLYRRTRANMAKSSHTYRELVEAADHRHRNRLWEAKAALVDAQWAAAAAYNVAGSNRSATSALKAAMEAADAAYVSAVVKSLAIRQRDVEEAWNAYLRAAAAGSP